MLGFGRTIFLPVNYVKVWGHDFAQQEGKTNRPRGGNTIFLPVNYVIVLVVLVAGQSGQ